MSDQVFHYGQRRLENDLVALEIFDPSVHAAPYVEALNSHPEMHAYVSLPDIKTEEEFVTKFYDAEVRTSPTACLYAVIDKTFTSEGEGEEEKEERPNTQGRFAGVASLVTTAPINAITEMGLMILPAFQRTHVATNAIGLLLLHTLDPPSAGGLGLRRVEWQCHTGNTASRRAASRMGFVLEGIKRWDRAFPRGTDALPVDALEKRNGTKGEAPGRHTAIYSIVWDEWEEKRPAVVVQMQRKQ